MKKSSTATPAPATPPALLDVQAVAQMLACSKSHIYRMQDAGQMPAALRFGNSVRWSRRDIDLWIEGGCMTWRVQIRLRHLLGQEKAEAPGSGTMLSEPELLDPATPSKLIEQLQGIREKHGDRVDIVDDDGLPINGFMYDSEHNRVLLTLSLLEDPHYTRLRRKAAWSAQDAAEDAYASE